MKARTCRRTASSRGSNQSPPAKGDGDVAAADVASVMAWVPSRSCRSEPTPPQLFPTNLAPRPAALGKFLPYFVHHPERGFIPIYPTVPSDMAHLVQITDIVREVLAPS